MPVARHAKGLYAMKRQMSLRRLMLFPWYPIMHDVRKARAALSVDVRKLDWVVCDPHG